MNLKTKLKRLEKDFKKSTVGAIQENCFKVIFTGDPNHEEQAERHKKEWLERYGTLEGLRIIYSNIPEPDLIDMDLYKAEV